MLEIQNLTCLYAIIGYRHFLGARTDLKHRDELVFGFAGDPDPQVLLSLLEIGPKLIELDMSQFEVGKEVLVELFTLQAAAGQPGAEGHFPNAKDFFDGGDLHPDHEQVQDSGNGGGQGFQAIQNRVTAHRELLAAELAAQILNALVFPMRAISDGRMDGLIIDQVVITARIGTEISLCTNGFFLASNPFTQAPREDVFCANDCRIVSASCFCFAVRAIPICFWFQNPWFGSGRGFLFSTWDPPQGLKLLKDQREQ